MSKTDPLTKISTRSTPQSRQADPRQVPNSGGGYAFKIDAEAQLRRFLILGTDGATFYRSKDELTLDNAQVVLNLAKTDPRRLVDVIVEVSLNGRAPKPNPALFALAVAASTPTDPADRSYALAQLPKVARTGTHLFQFTVYATQFRGWGKSLRNAVAGWYTNPDVGTVAYQAIKYRDHPALASERFTPNHRNLLRVSHPVTHDPARRALFDWITHKAVSEQTPDIVSAFLTVQASTDPAVWVEQIRAHRLPWEALPDAALSNPDVWTALIDLGLPMTALFRQLPRLTNLGLLTPFSPATKTVVRQLTDPFKLRKGRIHPVNVLVALRTYASGHGARGRNTWSPSRPIVDALDEAFYLAFDQIEPTGLRTRIGLDVSQSMDHPAGDLPLSNREAAAALAMATVRTEEAWDLVAFTGTGYFGSPSALTPLSFSPRQRLDAILDTTRGFPWGPTDCALPITDATAKGLEIDLFIVLTDNETNVGPIHPHQAIEQYRQKTGIDAKLVVMAMTPTPFSIADPSDGRMLDIVGMDSAAPNLIADFARGLV